MIYYLRPVLSRRPENIGKLGKRFYSHSIVLNHCTALNQKYKSARPTVRCRQDMPPKFSALDLKGEFGRSENFSLLSTIGIHRPIFEISGKDNIISLAKKTVSQGR
jgi:hypothetical protein